MAEAVEVRGPEPLLALAVQDVDPRQLAREPVGDLARAVGRVVVDHEHAASGAEHLAERAHHRLEVLALVVRRQADGRAHGRERTEAATRSPGHIRTDRGQSPSWPGETRRVGIIGSWRRRCPRNDEVAEQLELLADLLELEGEASFRVLAYRRAATRVRETASPIADLALQGQAKALSGIGKTIEEKIVQIVEDGEIHALTKRRDRIPPEVVLFTRLPGLGPKTAARIWQELGVTTIAELKEAAEAERLRALTGLGAKTEERILKALATAAKPAEPHRALLGTALPKLLAVVETLREHQAADLVSEAGSARRRRETVRDLDIIATASEPAELTDYLTRLTWVANVEARGDTKATVLSQDGLRFDLRVVPPEAYGNLLQHFTGSKHHNVALRERAVKDGLSVSEYGIQDVESGELFTTRDEARAVRPSRLRLHPARAARELG